MSESIDTLLDAPPWFTAAILTEPEIAGTRVDGASIVYRSWGEVGHPGIVLVHGGAAHSRWWDHIAPLLSTGHRVVALDLSGHGDSDHRESYSLHGWADEVLAVASAAGLGDAPTVIGHSLGGLIALQLAGRPGTAIRAAIVIDSPIQDPDAPHPPPTGFGSGRPRVYATEDDAVARFRPVPAQSSLPWVFDHIARVSVREVDGGWSWKFDSRIFEGAASSPAVLARLYCPLVFFAAENGLVSPRVRELVADAAGTTFVELPQAGHAPMLDQPLALVTGIRTALAGWRPRV